MISDVARAGHAASGKVETAKVLRWVGVMIVAAVIAVTAWKLLAVWPQTGATDTAETPSAVSEAVSEIVAGQPSGADVGSGSAETLLQASGVGAAAAASDGSLAGTELSVPEALASSASAGTVSSSIVAIAGTSGVELWSNTDGLARSTLPNGTVLTASGRSDDGAWLYVTTGGAAGWVEAGSVIVFNVSKLPVLGWGATTDTTTGQSAIAVSASVAEGTSPSVELETAGLLAEVPAEAASPEAEPTTAPASDDQALTATVSTTGAALNIRSGPGIDYSLLARAEPNALLTVVGRSETGEWVQVEIPGQEGGLGWVSADYVQVSSPLTSLPTVDPPSAASSEQATVANLSQGNLAQASSTTGLSGSLVIQQSNGGMVYAYELESDTLTPLTYGFDPAISPDGSTVAFTRESAENGVYLIDIDGRNLRLIYSGHAGLRSPKWSADGNWIVFSRSDEYEECVRMGSSCSTAGRASEEMPLTKEYDSNLAVIDINGGNYQDLATLSSARNPDWSEAGIVYQSAAGLQVTTNTPSATTQLIAYDWQKPYYQDPDWQLNGDLIVFQSQEASHWEIFTINADGSGLTALTRPSTTLVDELPSNVSPAWSPDGESIVFLSNRSADGSAGEWQIMVMDADGGNQRAVPIDLDLDYSFGGEQMLDWGV